MKKLFNKDTSASVEGKAKKSSYARKRTFKHGGYALVLTAAFVAVVIMLNIGATMLSKTVSLQVDLTTNQAYSIGKENKDYIKDVERDVNIVVCCDEETYKDVYYNYVSSQNYTTADGTSLQQYFIQNVHLLNEYDKLSKHITVEFADTQDPDFSKYVNRYPNVSLTTGDILVESSFTIDGKQINRHRVLGLTDILNIDTEASSTYSQYYGGSIKVVSGNNIETALTSAIYTVTADRTYNVALVTANGGVAISNLQGYMEMNNYQFTEIKSLIAEDIPEDTDIVIISAPSYDYSEDELKKIDDYLALESGKKKSLMYIASSSQSKLPNLNDFLSEWGYSVVPEHTVMETATSNYILNATNVKMSVVSENSYSSDISRKDYIYLASKNVPVIAKTPNNRSLKTVLEIASSAIAYPNDAGEDFSADDAEYKGPFVGLAVSSETEYDDDNKLMSASVIMASSTDIINTMFNSYSELGNIEMLSVVIDKVIGKNSVGIRFDPRTFETTTFTPSSETVVNVMKIVFVYVIPLAVLCCGVVVYIRRRRS